MSKTKKLPARSQVKPDDSWDLASLYPDDEAWEAAFGKWERQIAKYDQQRKADADKHKA